MRHAIFDDTGAITGIVSGPASAAILPNMVAVPDGTTDRTHRIVDRQAVPYTEAQAAALAAAPPWPSRWDASACQWVDERTLERVKADQWAQIKAQRDRLASADIQWNGRRFQADERAQQAMSQAALATMLGDAGAIVRWTDADNMQVQMTVEQLRQLAAEVLRRSVQLHERSQQLRDAIDRAESRGDVLAVVW